MNFEEIKSLEDQFQLQTYVKHPLSIERGEGMYVYDQDENRYLDFYGAHAVCVTGHSHPKIVKAIAEQAERLLFYSTISYNSTRAHGLQALASLAPEGLTKIFLCNSGAEANEAAIRLARLVTGKQTIIAMHGGFHGRSAGALSVTGIPRYKTVPPTLPGVMFVDFGDSEHVDAALAGSARDAAAVILEPIQSLRGVKMAPPEYYHSLRRICDEYQALLIFDEVQTGFGRTGANFFSQLVGVTPDILTAAKGIASGYPMAAMLTNDMIAGKVKTGDFGSTFGGGPLACAALQATINVIHDEKLANNAHEMGSYLAETLLSANINQLKEIRGTGLLLGLEFEKEVKPLIKEMLRERVIVGSSEDPFTLRLLPPLVLTKAHCDEFVTKLALASSRAFQVAS